MLGKNLAKSRFDPQMFDTWTLSLIDKQNVYDKHEQSERNKSNLHDSCEILHISCTDAAVKGFANTEQTHIKTIIKLIRVSVSCSKCLCGMRLLIHASSLAGRGERRTHDNYEIYSRGREQLARRGKSERSCSGEEREDRAPPPFSSEESRGPRHVPQRLLRRVIWFLKETLWPLWCVVFPLARSAHLLSLCGGGRGRRRR